MADAANSAVRGARGLIAGCCGDAGTSLSPKTPTPSGIGDGVVPMLGDVRIDAKHPFEFSPGNNYIIIPRYADAVIVGPIRRRFQITALRDAGG